MARFMTAVALMTIFLISACTPQGDAMPTSASLPTDLPQPTEEPAEDFTPTPEIIATAETQNLRPTLPPTFTPTAEGDGPVVDPVDEQPTEAVPTDVPTQDTSNPPATRSTGERPSCVDFLVDFDNSTSSFAAGTQPVAAWTSPAGAESYFIELSNQSGFLVLTDIYIADTSYTFDAALFEAGQVYAWSVYPLDANGDQMCFTRGYEIHAE